MCMTTTKCWLLPIDKSSPICSHLTSSCNHYHLCYRINCRCVTCAGRCCPLPRCLASTCATWWHRHTLMADHLVLIPHVHTAIASWQQKLRTHVDSIVAQTRGIYNLCTNCKPVGKWYKINSIIMPMTVGLACWRFSKNTYLWWNYCNFNVRTMYSTIVHFC